MEGGTKPPPLSRDQKHTAAAPHHRKPKHRFPSQSILELGAQQQSYQLAFVLAPTQGWQDFFFLCWIQNLFLCWNVPRGSFLARPLSPMFNRDSRSLMMKPVSHLLEEAKQAKHFRHSSRVNLFCLTIHVTKEDFSLGRGKVWGRVVGSDSDAKERRKQKASKRRKTNRRGQKFKWEHGLARQCWYYYISCIILLKIYGNVHICYCLLIS